MKEIQQTVEKFIQEQQTEMIAQQRQQETQEVKETSESDRDQEIKATVANATSSMIMADYMKYYHLMNYQNIIQHILVALDLKQVLQVEILEDLLDNINLTKLKW